MTLWSDLYRALSSTIKAPSAHFPSSVSSSKPTFSQRQTAKMTAKDFVEEKIAKHKIVVFSKTYCPYCKATKKYFADNYSQETVEVVELDGSDIDGSGIQDYLGQKTGARSVPRVFISGEFVGGNDALQAKPREYIDALIAKGN